MARARNIKPAFFTNDELAEIEPIGRLLFIGLWTIADCNGNVEWREKKIKAQILPYDSCDVKEIMINLDKSGFVRFYSDGDKIYLNITNFDKHQNPHKNEREKGTETPEYSESMRQVVDLTTITINHDKSGLNQDENETNRADSLNLIPDSPTPNKDNGRSIDQPYPLELVEKAFEHFWKIWKQAKKDIGKVDTSPKGDTLKKKWKPMFNASYFKTHTIEQFKQEVSDICQFVVDAHSLEGFNNFEHMQTGKLLSRKQWRDQ